MPPPLNSPLSRPSYSALSFTSFVAAFHHISSSAPVTQQLGCDTNVKASDKHAAAERRPYLVYVDGDVNENVDEVAESQAGNEGVGPVPHALVLVYNPQQGGVADQADHKDRDGNDGVDVLKVAVNGGRYCAHRRTCQPLRDSLIDRVGSRGPRVVAGPLARADGAVESRRLEGGVDEKAREMIVLWCGSVYLARSSGCHTGH